MSLRCSKEGLSGNEFLDFGEYDSYVSGITFQSVRDVIYKVLSTL
jgi:hypothetical protein